MYYYLTPILSLQAGSPSSSHEETDEEDNSQPIASTSGSNSFTERAKYIPLRLQLDERKNLRLLEAALSVSEYTDRVDVSSWKSKTSRIHVQIKDICAILSGLMVATDYAKGQKLVRVRYACYFDWRGLWHQLCVCVLCIMSLYHESLYYESVGPCSAQGVAMRF